MDRGHALLDIGGGARLERFGARVTDRPHPGALGARGDPAPWRAADLRFDRDRGWSGEADVAEPWAIEIDGLTLELKATEAGQVGLFPEHAAMLPWLRDRVAARVGGGRRTLAAAADPPAVLHLFAYTGLVTLALAAAGASVVHVDASKPTVGWARRNAERSGLADRPVRWIVDDAVAFTEREIRRGRRYAGIVLDPPSYGHGPGSGAWRIEDDLPALLAATGGLLDPGGFILLTAHTRGFRGGPPRRRDRPCAPPAGRHDRRRPAGAVDRGRTDPRPRCVRPVVRRGMMSSMASPTPPVLTSFANPRVKAATALRERRERDRAGLTLVDGAREVRRALDAGAVVVEAFVCEPLLAGPDARAALDLLRDRGVPVQATSEAVFAKLAFGERAEGLLAVVRIPSTDLADLALPERPARRRHRRRREARQRRRGPAQRRRSRGGRRRGRLATDRPVQSQRDPGQRRNGVHGADRRGADARGPCLAARPRPADRRGAGRRQAGPTLMPT